MGTIWYNVPKYVALGRRKRARRRQEDYLLLRTHGDILRDYLKGLTEDAQEPKAQDPRIKTAQQLEALALLLPPKRAETALGQARYLRACVKYGLPEE